MIRDLPEDMKISGKAVNVALKNVFEEGNFTFAIYEESYAKEADEKAAMYLRWVAQ